MNMKKKKNQTLAKKKRKKKALPKKHEKKISNCNNMNVDYEVHINRV